MPSKQTKEFGACLTRKSYPLPKNAYPVRPKDDNQHLLPPLNSYRIWHVALIVPLVRPGHWSLMNHFSHMMCHLMYQRGCCRTPQTQVWLSQQNHQRVRKKGCRWNLARELIQLTCQSQAPSQNNCSRNYIIQILFTFWDLPPLIRICQKEQTFFPEKHVYTVFHTIQEVESQTLSTRPVTPY